MPTLQIRFYIKARITKHFIPRFKKTLLLVKLRFEKYRLKLNIIEHQLLKPQVFKTYPKPRASLNLFFL